MQVLSYFGFFKVLSHSDLFKTTSNWLPIPIHLTSGIWKLAPDTSYRLQMLTKDLLQPIQAANPLKPWMPRARHPLPPTQFSQTTFPERWRDGECQLQSIFFHFNCKCFLSHQAPTNTRWKSCSGKFTNPAPAPPPAWLPACDRLTEVEAVKPHVPKLYTRKL